ncbi:MAG: hypothetical protein LBH66_01600, partial [Oscillospiraceae bacterium]|nr:hypothetical protein [Oscillospiraceae bacterium]
MANNRSTRSAPSAAPAPQAVVDTFALMESLINAYTNATIELGTSVTTIVMPRALVIKSGHTVTITSFGSTPKTLLRSPSLGGDAFVVQPGGTLRLTKVKIDGNASAVTAVSGALIATSGPDSVLDIGADVTLTNNKNQTSNGGIIRADGGQITMRGVSSVTNGSAVNGGGIALSLVADLVVENDAFIQNNKASKDGGGIAGIAWYGIMRIGGTISGNTAGS